MCAVLTPEIIIYVRYNMTEADNGYNFPDIGQLKIVYSQNLSTAAPDCPLPEFLPRLLTFSVKRDMPCRGFRHRYLMQPSSIHPISTPAARRTTSNSQAMTLSIHLFIIVHSTHTLKDK
jgi:hypothetical protein